VSAGFLTLRAQFKASRRLTQAGLKGLYSSAQPSGRPAGREGIAVISNAAGKAAITPDQGADPSLP